MSYKKEFTAAFILWCNRTIVDLKTDMMSKMNKKRIYGNNRTRGDTMESIWSEKWPRIPAEKRKLPKKVEVVVIGGGMAGLLCAYLLKESGVSAIVLEADRICSGQTKNTTAKITSQHELIYTKIARDFGEEVAVAYGKMNERAIREFERIVEQKKIDCDYMQRVSYLYTKTEAGALVLERECKLAKKAGIAASFVTETELPFQIKLALKYDRQAQFHPLKFLNGIVPELDIYEKTRAVKLSDQKIITDRGEIEAKHIVIATHFPFVNVPGFYFARMHQERSYVLAVDTKAETEQTENKDSVALNGMYYGIDSDGLSFRSADGLVLIGGKSARTGVRQEKDPFDALRKEAKGLWPEYREVAAWAAQDCMTLDGLPYIGRFSKSKPNWYVATGFEKWGMTNSMIAAMAIRDLITGSREAEWRCISPQRKWTSKAFRTLMQESAVTMKNFLTWKKPRCPHLGCRLVWNPYEKSWDCPCHGSRFAENGALIDNPAQRKLER